MNNFFGQLLIDLSNQIKSQVPEVRWIDQDMGQLERYEYKPEVSFPCALIDFAQANYSNLGNEAQFGEVMVQIRLGFAPFSSSSIVAPDSVREKALSFYDTEQKVFEAVMGWNNDVTQPFVRMSAVTEHRENDSIGLRVRVLTFSTAYQDESVVPVYTKHQANLQIDYESPN